MTQIIALVVGAVALVVLCECCYALGKITGKREGIEECNEMLRQRIAELVRKDQGNEGNKL